MPMLALICSCHPSSTFGLRVPFRVCLHFSWVACHCRSVTAGVRHVSRQWPAEGGRDSRTARTLLAGWHCCCCHCCCCFCCSCYSSCPTLDDGILSPIIKPVSLTFLLMRKKNVLKSRVCRERERVGAGSKYLCLKMPIMLMASCRPLCRLL